MTIPKSVVDAATQVADNAFAAVLAHIEADNAALRDQATAVWRFHYHDEILKAMPLWRRRVAWRHKLRRRNARAAIKANVALGRTCALAKVGGHV